MKVPMAVKIEVSKVLEISVGLYIVLRRYLIRIGLQVSLFLCVVFTLAHCLASPSHALTGNFNCGSFDTVSETSICHEPTTAVSTDSQQSSRFIITQNNAVEINDTADERPFHAILDQQIRTRCHMGYCGWFTITARNLETETRDGVLYRIDSHWWSAEFPDGDYNAEAPIEDDGKDSSFVFCSLTRPATFSREGENWTVTSLSPNDPDGVFGYSMSAYIFYFAACHGIVTDADDSMAGLAKNLGYQISANQAEQSKISTPQEYIQTH